MTEITLVRHGETDWNRNLIIQGRHDIPLNEFGMEQAKKTAQNFQSGDFDYIFCTPLIRTKQTAMIIADEIGYTDQILVASDLIERNFGDADGKSIKDYYHLVLENNIPNLETEEEMKERVIKGLKDIASCYPDKKVLVIGHSHTIKSALAAIDERSYDFQYKLFNCSITKIRFNPYRDDFTLVKVNYNDFL